MEAVNPVCRKCGKEMKIFDVIEPDTGEKVAEEVACINEWRESHNDGRT